MLSLSALVQPLLSGWAIDEIGKGTDARIGYVAWLAFGIFAMDLASNVFSNISGYLGDRMAYYLSKILSERYYEHLLKLPQQYFDTELTGRIISRLSRSVEEISNFMNMMSNNFLQFIFSTVFSLAIVAYYSWEVAIMLFALYPIYVWMTARSSGKWLKYQDKINEHKDISAGRFAEVVGQIKVVKSFISETRELAHMRKHMQAIVDTEKPQSRHWHVNDVRRRLVLNAIFLMVFMFIFVRAAQGIFTPGEAVTLILFAMQIRIPVFTISFLVDRTQRAIGDSKDYFEVMAIKPDITDNPGAKDLQVKKGEITFRNVEFSYESKLVLRGISFTIKPGSKVALVGESGEGKTTLTNLLLRLYEPAVGEILVSGENIANITQTSLRRAIGVVFQDAALFSGTIRENIAYGNPGANQQSIKAAAVAANAHEFISTFEQGYDTQIGERGLKLSGGQKQRIAIARALLKDAPILILDEATSSLDNKSEALVQEALSRLMKGRTTIIIAHRLSTIQHVDQIVTLRAGKVDEIGKPAELANSGGIYEQLLSLQKGKKTESVKRKLRKFEINA